MWCRNDKREAICNLIISILIFCFYERLQITGIPCTLADTQNNAGNLWSKDNRQAYFRHYQPTAFIIVGTAVHFTLQFRRKASIFEALFSHLRCHVYFCVESSLCIIWLVLFLVLCRMCHIAVHLPICTVSCGLY